MKKINFEDIDIIICNQLILQSQLDSNFVKNLASRYGADFSRNETDKIFDSIAPSEAVLFFITEKKPSDVDVSMTNEDSTITQYSSYDIRVSIYGDSSVTIATKVVARLRTAKVRNSLYESGIHVRSVEEVGSLHEFKNNVAWLRSDFIIHVDCEHEIEQIVDDSLVERLNIISDKELK